MHSIYKIPLPSNYHASLINKLFTTPNLPIINIRNLKTPPSPFNLALAETWPKGTKGSLLLLMQSFILVIHCSHYTTHHKDFIKKIINSSPPIHSPNGRPLLFL